MRSFNPTPSIEIDPTQERLLQDFYTHYQEHDYKAASEELNNLEKDTLRYFRRAHPIHTQLLSFKGLFPKI